MRITTTWRRTAVLVASGALVLSACTSAPETDLGITEEPCPDAVNPDNGCIYLGIISDLTEGPFAALGVPITDANHDFWADVNANGGVGGYDVDTETYVRDNKYNPEEHNRVYQEIEGDILAIAQTLGSPTTAAIASDLAADQVIAVPASWTSALEFDDNVLESGNSYCVESSNALDYYVEQNGGTNPAQVMSVHYPGDYGGDGAAGAAKWAEINGVEFIDVEQIPAAAGGTVDAAVTQILEVQPEVVHLAVAPGETAQIVGATAAQGFTGRFIGNSPTWNVALTQTEAFPALQALYWQAGPWGPWDTDTPGHEAMRAAADANGRSPSGGYVAGWAWQYPLLTLFEIAAENGDMTRAGLISALENLDGVDYQGMIDEGGGVFAGSAREQAFGRTLIAAPDADASDGVSVIQDFFEGPTQSQFTFEEACFEEMGF